MLKKERYNIMLSPRIITAIDNYAKRIDSSRSELVNDILLKFVSENELFFNSNEDDCIIGQLEVF